MSNVRPRWSFALALTVPSCLLLMSSESVLTAETIPDSDPAVFRLEASEQTPGPGSGFIEPSPGQGDLERNNNDEPVWLTGNLAPPATASPHNDYQLDLAGF